MNAENKDDNKKNKKTATNNQWTSTHPSRYEDDRERKDGPGGN